MERQALFILCRLSGFHRKFGGNIFSFLDGEDAVHGMQVNGFDDDAGPVDFELIYLGNSPSPKWPSE